MQSYVKLLLLNSNFISFSFCSKEYLSTSFSLVRLSFLVGDVPFLKPQIKLYFQKSVMYFGIGVKGFPFPVKFLFSFFF